MAINRLNLTVSIIFYFQSGDWSHGLFNCFDDLGICIIAYLAPCVLFGQNAEKIGEGSCLLCGNISLSINFINDTDDNCNEDNCSMVMMIQLLMMDSHEC